MALLAHRPEAGGILRGLLLLGIQLRNSIVVVLGQDGAHLEVGSAHLQGILFVLRVQVGDFDCADTVLLRGSLFVVGLRDADHCVSAWRASEVDVLLVELVLEPLLLLELLLASV